MSETEAKERLDLVDLEPKMKFEGTVTNVELYGAFVDIGAERDGLVHISQISQDRVNRVADVLHKGDRVTVWVQQVRPEQGRISLTMVEPPERMMADLKPEQILTGTVTKLTPYGAFVDIGVERDGLVHISEMDEGHIAKPSDVAQEGDEVEVRVIKVNQKRRRIELSMIGMDNTADALVEEEGEEAPLTAMELAWQDAMRREGMSVDAETSQKGKGRRKSDIRRQQADIIARTLKEQAD
jgi:ribosomal protein S1